MKYEIVIKKQPWQKLWTLMKNIKTINDDDEIGGWFTGDWTISSDKSTARLLLDDFTIPKQKVSRAEVDMSPTTLIEMIKDKGVHYTNRIKAHWHIHPFGTGKTSWSSIDESKIKDYMDPVKGRTVFVFLLSSYDVLKGRIEMNSEIKNPLTGDLEIVRTSIDDIEVVMEEDVYNSDELLNQIKEEIKNNVERAKSWYESEKKDNSNDKWKDWKDRYESVKDKKDSDEKEELGNGWGYEIKVKKNRIIVKTTIDFYDFLMTSYGLSGEIANYQQITETKKGVTLVYQLLTKDEKEINTCMRILDNEFRDAYEVYDDMEDYNKGFYGYSSKYDL